MNYAIKLLAPNDTNGNPRRGWLIFAANGKTLGWVEEGYRGYGALKMNGLHEGKNLIVLANIQVTFSEVREARRLDTRK